MIRKILCLLMSLSALFSMLLTVCASSDTKNSARSAAVYCVDNKEFLYCKNAELQLPMASTTKIMTAILALEANMPSLSITISPTMLEGSEGSSMGLKSGDIITLEGLIYGLLLSSGNDAANVVANVLAGSISDFCAMMNSKAKELSMSSTNFVNPSGLPDKNHYSTAHDMALLTAYALSNPLFVEICSCVSKPVYFGNPPYLQTLYNHNKLLQLYEGAIGVKTGFTKASGRCLVSAARKQAITLIAVTLNDPDDWNDHRRLLDFGFSLVRSITPRVELPKEIPVAGAFEGEAARLEAAISPIVVGNGSDAKYRTELLLKKVLFAPVSSGRQAGLVRIFNESGDLLSEAPIYVKNSIEAYDSVNQMSCFDRIKNKIIKFFTKMSG